MSIITKVFGLNTRERKELAELFNQALREAVVELSPEKRYLLILSEGSTEDASRLAELFYTSLDLKNYPNLKLVIVEGPVKLLEL